MAALTVVGYHTSLGFLPAHMALFLGQPIDPRLAFWTRFWFAALNGPAAVILFFVLSGFVLTRSCFASGSPEPLMRTAVKRYPRLAGPVLLVCLLAWLLFRLGLIDCARASALTGSQWLAAFAHMPGPGLKAAIKQGLWRTLLRGDVSYNTSLWTMRVELIGSFAALAAAAALLVIGRRSRKLALLAGVAGYILLRGAPILVFLSAFLAGVTLSGALNWVRPPRLPWPLGLFMAAASLYMAGFTQAAGDYAWLAPVPPAILDAVMGQVPCSVVIIVVVECCPPIRSALSRPLFAWLGRVSFALYLMHYLVIISAASFVRVALDGWGMGPATAATFATTFVVSLLLATPFTWYETWLMRRLNVLTDWLLPRAAWSPPLAVER